MWVNPGVGIEIRTGLNVFDVVETLEDYDFNST